MSLCSGCLHKWLFPLLDSGFWVQIVVIIHINICRIQYKVWPLIITWSCVIFFNQIQAKFLMWLTAILMTIWFFKKYRKWIVKVTQSCPTLLPHGLYSSWHSPGQNIGVGKRSLLQGSSQSRVRTQVSHITGGFFTSWATMEAQRQWREYKQMGRKYKVLSGGN